MAGSLFAPPRELIAEPFARLPERHRLRGRRSSWVERQLHGAPTDCFLEGPAFDGAGNLFVVDIPYGRIFRVSPQGEFELFVEYDGEPNGLKFHRDGRAFVADFRHGIMVLDPQTRTVEPLLTAGPDGPFLGVNDLHFASNGDLYFTDQGYSGLDRPVGRLYRLRANGRLDMVLDGLPSPNGLALNRAENTLFLNVTRANAVWRVPLDADGRCFKVGTFIQLSGGNGPDGLAIDEEDGLAVAHLGLGSVWVFDRLGEPRYRIRSPEGLATTNLAYRGHDLYITESATGSIMKARLPTAGLPLFGPVPTL